MSDQSNLSSFETGDSQQADQYECSICGRSFDSANGRGVHMGHNHTKYEIKTELIAELQTLADRLGQTPSYTDMRRKGKYSPGSYETHFNTWNEALKQANFEINEQLSKDRPDLLNELNRLADELGRAPTAQDMRHTGDYSVKPYKTEFGSWNEALKRAHLETHVEIDIDNSDLLDELDRLVDELGRTPSYNDMTQHGVYDYSVYERRFGSWNEALKRAHLEINEQGPAERKIPDSDLIDELKRLASELGQTPVREDMSREGAYGYTIYERRFGSWNEALKQADLAVRRERNIDDTTLLDELERLADELGRTPTYNDMTRQGRYGAGIYEQRFDSWIEALDEIGLEHEKIRNPDHLDHKVRSTYEEKIADILLDENITYEYEPWIFEYGDGRIYTPDFVTDQYVIEVKGFTHAVEREDDGYPDEITKAEIAMEQLTHKQYVIIQNNGEKLPADRHIQWDERERLRQLL